MSFQTPITIAKAINAIQSNQYVLPAIQREFVWDAEQIEKLFDSLMRGYPISSFLFWQVKPENLGEFQFYRFMDRYHQRDYRHNEPINLTGGQNVTAVLDGQQRLTALNIGLKGTYAEKLPYYHWANDRAFPTSRLYVDLLNPPEEDSEFAYEFNMLREDQIDAETITNNDQFWFPVGKVLTFKEMEETLFYCIEHSLTERGNKFPSSTLVRLWKVITHDPVINYFLEEDQDLDKVLNIFIRVNSGGTPLSYSDMLLSIATAQWQEKDAREEIYALVDSLNSVGETFNFSKDFILKASLVLANLKAIEFKVNNFNRENMLTIEQQWDNIARALRQAVKLVASWGYNRETLISNNAVIPLAYFLYKQGTPSGFVEAPRYTDERDKMRRWLTIALLKRTFGGQSDNVLRRIRHVVEQGMDGFPEQAIYEDLRSTAKSMTFDDDQIDGLLGQQYGQAYTFTVLAMLYPWLKFHHHFHVDHIFPRSMFKEKELQRRGIPQADWHLWLDHKDDLANLQLLEGLVNQNKLDKEFEDWLHSSAVKSHELEIYCERHLIPDVDLSFENFPVFLEARQELIRAKLTQLLMIS